MGMRLAMRLVMSMAVLAVAGMLLAARAGGIVVDEPYARPPLGSGKVAAAYMTLRNESGVADRLVAAEGDVASRIELHTHVMERRDGRTVMKMRRVPHMEVPAGGRTELRPGGLHIMLIGVRRALKPGDVFDLTLVFEKAGRVTVQVPVKPLSATMRHMTKGSMPQAGRQADGRRPMRHE